MASNAEIGSSRSQAILVYEVAGQRFGLPAAAVQEVVRAVAIVPLPEAPRLVEGVIDLRGEIVPVVDLRARFSLPSRPLSSSDQFLIVRAGDRALALRVDRALDLVEVDPDRLEAARTAFADGRARFGYAKLPDGLVPILDADDTLPSEEAEELRELLPPRADPPR